MLTVQYIWEKENIFFLKFSKEKDQQLQNRDFLGNNRSLGIWRDIIVAGEYRMIYRGLGCLAIIEFAYSSTPSPLSSVTSGDS